MKIGSAFPSKNMKAADLADGPIRAVIKTVVIEEVGQNKERKPVVYFKGKDKGMVLNKTNSRTISKIAGSEETDDWTGVEVVIYPSETEFGGEMVDCLRIRALKKTAPPAPKPAPEHETGETDEEMADRFVATDDDLPF